MKNIRRIILSVLAVVTFCTTLSMPSANAYMTLRHLSIWSTWGHDPGPNGYLLDAVEAPPGETGKVAMIKSTLPDQPDCYQSMFVSFSAKAYLGKKVEFKAKVKTDNVHGAVNLWWTADEHDNNIASAASASVTDAPNWRQLSVVMPVPQNAERLRVGFMLQGGGTAYFAKPEFTIVADDAKITEPNAQMIALIAKDYQLRLEPNNLLFDNANASFDPHSNSIHNWGVYTGSGFEAEVDKSIDYRGKPAARIECKSTDTSGFASIYQIFSAQKFVGQRVQLSGFVKTEGVKDWDGLLMQIDDGEHMLAFDAMEDRPIKGTMDWTRYSTVLDVPATSKRIKIGFLQAGVGKSWLSNLSFSTVSKDVPVTGKSVSGERIPPRKSDPKPEFEFK